MVASPPSTYGLKNSRRIAPLICELFDNNSITLAQYYRMITIIVRGRGIQCVSQRIKITRSIAILLAEWRKKKGVGIRWKNVYVFKFRSNFSQRYKFRSVFIRVRSTLIYASRDNIYFVDPNFSRVLYALAVYGSSFFIILWG